MLIDRRLILLLVTQAVAGSTMPVLFLVAGLIGAKIAPSLELSTVPMSLLVVGVALASPLATFIMAKLGRKRGHLAGLILTQFGVAVTALAIWKHDFTIFNGGCLLSGAGVAFNNQVRFSAAEGAPVDRKALVHSWVLMFSLFAAFIGPWLTEFGRDLVDAGAYAGSLLLLLICLGGMTILFLWYPSDSPSAASTARAPQVPWQDVIGRPQFWLGALSGMASFATMTLIMSATPLQMHELEKFTSEQTTMTIQSHIVAMFLPSLFSGLLLSWLGLKRLVGVGASLFVVCIGITYFNSHFHHYWWALVLLGVGWNFMFLAGSTWISVAFSGPERFKAQGLNDILVFGVQAIASLAAGWLLFAFGWKALVLIPLPLLLGLLIFILKFRVT